MLLWGLILIAQNSAFTWVSRARNSGSDWYHAIAAIFSNGVWFAAFYFTFGFLDRIHEPTTGLPYAFLIGAVYVVCTVIGSVVGGKFLRRYVEKGKRQVGHYDDKEARIRKLEERLDLLVMGRKTPRPGVALTPGKSLIYDDDPLIV